MKYEMAMKLADALESGKYKQTKSKLANAERTEHCCLGVACELAILDGVKVTARAIDHHNDFMAFNMSEITLPKAVQEHFGFLSELGGNINELGNTTYTLTYMNDNGKTFPEIAAHIRKNWEQI